MVFVDFFRDVALSLDEVFSFEKSRVVFAVSGVVFLAAYLVSSGVFIPSLLEFNPTAEAARVLLVVLVALLSALLVASFFNSSLLAAMLYYQNSKFKAVKGKAGLAGSILGFFTTACPYCTPLVLSWVGLGGSLYFIADYGVHIGVASVLLLLFSIVMVSKNICNKACVPKGG